ncbi:MAG: hypothetical protein KA775_04840 [Ottowia sp.]|jgi:hypothetical protein|uniref:Uncharacterized protein n=1 Tax=Ottowia beijingensis TaxID=1207057 RepID=A0A853IUZ1_9BURK|nr:hypothetical protein [Ottowia beijingensis]MBP6779886.1 hypothetical protein [Ottowia sp.]MBP7531127.1 hypothetical protein [Ottowia sp.]MBP7536012.1 hypothetical protein [Ottowia sp.]MBP9953088.1 hypothetical protein [Ottowia sp.]NZA01731.1 hypothetical protein [Ottowia beijingensis]
MTALLCNANAERGSPHAGQGLGHGGAAAVIKAAQQQDHFVIHHET